MNRALIITLALLVSTIAIADDCHPIIQASLDKANILYVGTPKTSFECKDKTGNHIFIASIKTTGVFGELDFMSEVYFYKYTLTNGIYSKVWEAKDYGQVLVSVELHKFIVADADKDGEYEAYAFYSKSADGLDADTVKLLINYKNFKYAIRGSQAKQPEDFDVRTSDEKFKGLPKAVRQFAYRIWDEIF